MPKERLEDDYTLQDLANDVIELVKVRRGVRRVREPELMPFQSQHVGWKEVDIMGFSMVSLRLSNGGKRRS